MAKKKFHFSPSSPITNSFNLLKEFREQAKAHQWEKFEIRETIAAGDGFEIVHAFGKTWEDNSYTLRRIPPATDNETVRAACHKCGNV